MELPKAFEQKMKVLLQEDYDKYRNAYQDEYGQTLRVNRLKMHPADFIRRFPLSEGISGSVAWCENGFYYKGEERLSMHPWYYAGMYYLQEPSAMAPASFLPVEPGDKVLDLCAAPGGKTTALAAKLEGEGLLIANDISISRCKALVKNIELAGVKNAMVVCEEPARLAEHFPEYFDKILIDAPCSGEGMFRKDPSMMQYWSEEEVERYGEIQRGLLELGYSMLKPGGMLMYSTCTYSPEEDEMSVQHILEKKEALHLLPLPLEEGVDQGHPEWVEAGVLSEERKASLKHCRRYWNHRLAGEGQFMALFQKDKEAGTATKTPKEWRKKAGKLPEELENFLKELPFDLPKDRIYMVEERVFLLPDPLPDMKRLRIVRSGLYLGDSKKKRFEPSQALALALKEKEWHNVLMLASSDERVERYLRCETIQGECKDGWVLILVDGYPLGWGKASRGTIKNKYPAAWRKV